jgi:DNA mismatch endonuclease (patch repair protein)
MMSGIRGKDTAPELQVRGALHAAGFRYRLHARDLPGRPDIVLRKQKIAIFVHGCFWHVHARCRFAQMPKTRAAWWKAKLEGNRRRDAHAVDALHAAGWTVFVIWECELREASDNTIERLLKEVRTRFNTQVPQRPRRSLMLGERNR